MCDYVDVHIELGVRRMMTGARLDFTISDGVARICFNRPEAVNAIDLTFAKEFEAAAQTCSTSHARVVLITSTGRIFCAGGDLKSFAKEPDVGAHLEEVTRHLHAGIEILVEMDAPVVIAVNGAAAGAALGLVCAADIVVAGESATFVMAYSQVGLTPDGSSSWFLPQHIGLRRAIDLALTNRVLKADEALAWGLVSRAVADDQVLIETEAIVEQLAKGPTAAYGASTRLLRSAFKNSLHAHLSAEAVAIAEHARTVDGLEGINAFVERRRPVFSAE